MAASQEPQNTLIITASPTAPFKSFSPNDLPYKDTKLSIFFENQEMMEDTLILLRFNCPDVGCDYIAGGWNDLKTHVRGTHGNLMWYGRLSFSNPSGALKPTQTATFVFG